jgi:hypothetical protein
VHDAALETLVHEVGVARVGSRQTGGQAPHLEVERGQGSRVAGFLSAVCIGAGNRIQECRLEVDGQAVPEVWHVDIHERLGLGDVVVGAWRRSGSEDVGVLGRQAQAVDVGDRQHV